MKEEILTDGITSGTTEPATTGTRGRACVAAKPRFRQSSRARARTLRGGVVRPPPACHGVICGCALLRHGCAMSHRLPFARSVRRGCRGDEPRCRGGERRHRPGERCALVRCVRACVRACVPAPTRVMVGLLIPRCAYVPPPPPPPALLALPGRAAGPDTPILLRDSQGPHVDVVRTQAPVGRRRRRSP